jgi:hypothetical protein
LPRSSWVGDGQVESLTVKHLSQSMTNDQFVDLAIPERAWVSLAGLILPLLAIDLIRLRDDHVGVRRNTSERELVTGEAQGSLDHLVLQPDGRG